MKSQMQKFSIHIDPVTEEILNCGDNTLFLQNNVNPKETRFQPLKSILNMDVYAYFDAYSQFIKHENTSISPVELLSINERYFMVQIHSSFECSTNNHGPLLLYFNYIELNDNLLVHLKCKKILDQRALRIQLEAAHEQIELVLQSAKQRQTEDKLYFQYL